MTSEINEYIKKYCEKHNCSKEEAKKHKVIQMVKRYWDEQKTKK